MSRPSSETETDVVRRRYDRGAARYDWVTWPMEQMAMDRFRGRLIGQVMGPRVLEVGVGTGRNLPLYRPGLQIDAIDFSPRMLERARRKPLPPGVTLHLMDVQDLQFAPGSFDSVVATCVFCSVPDPVRGLSEIRRVLRPGGHALFLEHVRPGAQWLAKVFDWLDPLVSRAGPHINRRTLDNINAAGFAVERDENLLSDVVKLVVAH
ncbi:MAG: class I SAM-dependent methyltransferase [Cyanobacteria bacterium]|nr:class I SAM-dependent methyltransferase [Cyanobacteriota bacterium]